MLPRIKPWATVKFLKCPCDAFASIPGARLTLRNHARLYFKGETEPTVSFSEVFYPGNGRVGTRTELWLPRSGYPDSPMAGLPKKTSEACSLLLWV